MRMINKLTGLKEAVSLAFMRERKRYEFEQKEKIKMYLRDEDSDNTIECLKCLKNLESLRPYRKDPTHNILKSFILLRMSENREAVTQATIGLYHIKNRQKRLKRIGWMVLADAYTSVYEETEDVAKLFDAIHILESIPNGPQKTVEVMINLLVYYIEVGKVVGKKMYPSDQSLDRKELLVEFESNAINIMTKLLETSSGINYLKGHPQVKDSLIKVIDQNMQYLNKKNYWIHRKYQLKKMPTQQKPSKRRINSSIASLLSFILFVAAISFNSLVSDAGLGIIDLLDQI